VGTVDGPPLPLHTAGSFPTLLVERWRLVCAVNNRREEPDNHSIPTNDAWDRVAKMLFPDEPVRRRSPPRDVWLINRYRPPNDLKHQPASMLPGGITYISHHPGKVSAPNELIAEVDQAYFRLSLQDHIDEWFVRLGFDLEQPSIPKHLFEAAVRAEFGQLLPEPVKLEFGHLPPEPVKPVEKYKRYPADDGL
jgi:hypothetical protein